MEFLLQSLLFTNRKGTHDPNLSKNSNLNKDLKIFQCLKQARIFLKSKNDLKVNLIKGRSPLNKLLTLEND